MRTNCWYEAITVGCACALLLTGCSQFRPLIYGDADDLDPESLQSGNMLLGARFEESATRVTDVEFASVRFGYDSFLVEESELAKVERVADYMERESGIRLVSEGHCDERGSREYNMSLGEHRALAVRAHLIRLGIDGARIQTRSYGEERPADSGHNESSWCNNRRTEFAFYR